MMPRLQKLRDDLPGIDLRIQTADRDLDLVAEDDPARRARRHCREDFPDYEMMPLADEEIVAVAGPSYLARAGRRRPSTDLLSHRLIHLEEPFRRAADWREWLHSAGVASAPPRGLVINDYALVIQAVMEGEGIALGWRHLAERLLSRGLLVRVTDHVDDHGSRFPCRLAEEPPAERRRAPRPRLAGSERVTAPERTIPTAFAPMPAPDARAV